MTTTDVSFDHERAFRDADIRAHVEYVTFDQVTVTLSADDLDRLLDVYADGDTLEEAAHAAHDAGWELGADEGYAAALSDIDNEMGVAWEVVGKLVKAAYDDGYQAACDDIAELA